MRIMHATECSFGVILVIRVGFDIRVLITESEINSDEINSSM